MNKAQLKKLVKNLRRQAKKTSRSQKPSTALTVTAGKKPLRLVGGTAVSILSKAKLKARGKRLTDERSQVNPFAPYVPMAGVVPKDAGPLLAMDSEGGVQVAVNWAQSTLGAYWSEGLTFLGYAYLAELTLRPEYRVISQVIATEMTRKWVKFKSATEKNADEVAEGMNEEELADTAAPPEDVDDKVAGDADPAAALIEMQLAKQQKNKEQADQQQAEAEQRAAEMASVDDKAEKIKELEAEFKRLQVRDLFYKLAEMDGWFGRVHLYIDLQDKQEKSFTDNREELLTDIGDGQDEVTKAKVTKGSLKRLAIVEPVWTYPQNYNANDPLKEEWYNPSTWFVMGKQIHASRLLTYVSRPVPDILKPAYAFGGLSLSQIAKPYVDNWLTTRQSVNDIIHAFSVMILMTDLGSQLQASDQLPGEGSALFNRLDLFNMLRDNRGIFAIDKDGEDFKNVSVPLSTLDELQAQSQEHMASVTRIPLVKLLGISPHGLNATAEPELKAFWDTIHASQESNFRPILTKVMHFVMINLWGEIDEEIDFEFVPLEELNAKEQAEVRKIEAETDDILINGCNALHPEETRKRLANDPENPYHDIDLADIPDKPVDEGPLNIHGTEPFGKGAQAEPGAEGDEPGGAAPPFGKEAA